MAIDADSLSVSASVTWSQTQTNLSGNVQPTIQGPDALRYSVSPDAATYSEIQVAQYTIAASGTQTVNLNSFVNLFGATKTITKALGILIKASNAVTGGQLQIAPGASNAINFWLGGTTPTLTLSCGTGGSTGCALLIADNTTRTISGSVKNIDISNPGSQDITVTIAVLCGP